MLILHRASIALVTIVLLLAACAADSPSPSVTDSPSAAPSESASPSSTPAAGEVTSAPGSDSAVYAPNPGAIVVAIDAGHGGCLDWGVPDPSVRGVQLSEKTLTLAIAQRLRDLLEADGIGVLMIRDGDEALAGDDYPDLDCHGPPWRDVDGDGKAGFEDTGRIRTRDELQARIDRANVAAADAFVSIHINSPTEGGQVIEIAFSQTFYDDETPWGADGSARLADGLQRGIVAAIDPLTTYDRQDRGTEAVAYYAVSRTWAEGDTCEVDGDTFCKPQRGLLMPSALSEVGSISLRPEHDLLASAEGQEAVAQGLFDGLVAYFGDRELAGRIGLADQAAWQAPEAVDGDGPPFWPPVAPEGALGLRLTNTGTAEWPAGMELLGGWEATNAPYLPRPPRALETLDVEVPSLAPGESVVVTVPLPQLPSGARAVAWISLGNGGVTLADLGSPALQLSSNVP